MKKPVYCMGAPADTDTGPELLPGIIVSGSLSLFHNGEPVGAGVCVRLLGREALDLDGSETVLGEASGGLFSTAEEDGSYSASLGTSAESYARWAAPGAAETRFEPALDGYSWTRRRLKAHPGQALVYVFTAD